MVSSQAQQDQVTLAMERGPPRSIASVPIPTQRATFEDQIYTDAGWRQNEPSSRHTA